jgi:hypothetical protein
VFNTVIAPRGGYSFPHDYLARDAHILQRKNVKPQINRGDIVSRPALIDDGIIVCSPPNRLPVAVSFAKHLGMHAQASLTRNSEGKEELTLLRFGVLPIIDASVIFSNAEFATLHVLLRDQPTIVGDGRRHPGVSADIVKLVGDLFKVNLEENFMAIIFLGVQADCKVIASKEVPGMTMGEFEDALVGRLNALHKNLNDMYRPYRTNKPPVMVGVVGAGSRNMMTVDPGATQKVDLK